ncbi:hypothetical protein N7516_011245 [Penicillium verrucosum]|uniref:uncharacterized protein n=1 Tax=Penicillium verrucosum TaxID=60171 RepID=UPI002545560B|nr:uncharacterized protein N7516_011245 [Penicillium verrucosum]KAJ5920387.1 hypothetical protein N7516_011245 [Penicillium verrucosum]
MVAISELLQSCLRQFLLLINSDTLANHTGEVPLQEWRDELGRLRVWAANIGAHQTRQSSLDYRLRDASHIKGQIVRLLEQFQELLTDLQDVLEESSDDEAQDHQFKDLGGSESENSTTEVQEIHQTLVETIDQLYQMSMIIRKPAQHDRLVGTKKLDSEPFQFWAKQHSSTRYPNADALAIDRISSAMARQRAILKYRERHHAKLSQGIVSESDNKSTLLSETVATDVFKEIPGQLGDMASDAGISETSYGGTLLEGTGADTPKIPPIPKKGTGKRPFECPYCFYIITVRDRRAWARHIFRDLMPYVCIFPGCSTPNKLYGGRRQWHHHIQQAHVSVPSTNGTYDCSICKQGSLPAVGFQRHVGQHLEELALFLLPRTDEDEDENEEGTDENLNNVSLDDNSVESVEQRHDTNDAATPASDSNHSDLSPLGGGPSKHSTSSAEAKSSDRESLGELESNVEDEMRASSSPYNREYELAMSQKLMEKSNPQRDIDMWKKHQDTERLEHEPEEYHGRTDPRNFSESQLLREEEIWSEGETSGRLRKSQQFKRVRTHQSAEDLKAEERYQLNRLAAEKRADAEDEEARRYRIERLEVIMRREVEKEEREKLVREETWKENARLKTKFILEENWEGLARLKEERKKSIRVEKWEGLARLKEEERRKQLIREISDEDTRKVREAEGKRKKEDALKDFDVEEWKLEQERINQMEAEMQSKEFRERMRSMNHTDEEIDDFINKKKAEKKQNDKKNEESREQLRTAGFSDAVIEYIFPGKKKERKEGKHKEPKVEEPKTTWIMCHRKHLLPETLIAYDLPWDWDEEDPNYIIIKKWIADDSQDELFYHTRRLRERKVVAQTSPPESPNVKKDREYIVRKKSPSGRVRIFG